MMAKHEIVLLILCYVCKISESMFKPPSAKRFLALCYTMCCSRDNKHVIVKECLLCV